MRAFLAPCVVLLLSLLAPAQEVASGPAAGTPLAPAVVYSPAGPDAGKEFDAAAAIGQGPGALLFVHELSRNTAPMIGGLERLAAEYRVLGLRAFVVRVAENRNDAEAEAKRASASLRMREPIVVSVDGAEGPGRYALNRKCTLTLVTAKDGRVQRAIGLTDTGRQDLPRLKEWIEEVTGPMPRDDAALRALLAERLPKDPAALREVAVDMALELQRLRAAPPPQDAAAMQRADRMGRSAPASRPGATSRKGAPPRDAELTALLRRAIRMQANVDELDTVFAAIEKRAALDADLRRQAVDMLELIGSLGYGSDAARAMAQKFVKAHARD